MISIRDADLRRALVKRAEITGAIVSHRDSANSDRMKIEVDYTSRVSYRVKLCKVNCSEPPLLFSRRRHRRKINGVSKYREHLFESYYGA